MTGAVIDDAALAERCRGGDDAAWAELVDRYSRYVYAIAARGYDLRDDDAEDVFQDVFARAYSNLDKLRDPGALRPWLGQLTRRLCVDHIRANREEPTGEQDEEATLGTLAHLDRRRSSTSSSVTCLPTARAERGRIDPRAKAACGADRQRCGAGRG